MKMTMGWPMDAKPTNTLRKVVVYSVDDGEGYRDQMDRYARDGEHAEYYYVNDVDPAIQKLQEALTKIQTATDLLSAQAIARRALHETP